MTLLADTNGAQVFHCDWRALLDVVPACDALIVDAPYSERTHAGHDAAVAALKPYQRTDGSWRDASQQPHVERQALTYAAWTAADVCHFVSAWSSRVGGWLVSITDDVLAPTWREAMAAAGRYAFAPLPFVAPGSRVRLAGDGPSCWTTWVVVSRPRTKAMATWGTLPGAYVLPRGWSEKGRESEVVGGKPTWLMERLCEDYSRPGDLVVDPCCGAGTTLLGAIRTGRRAIGGDALREHAEIAARRVSGMQQVPLFAGGAA